MQTIPAPPRRWRDDHVTGYGKAAVDRIANEELAAAQHETNGAASDIVRASYRMDNTLAK